MSYATIALLMFFTMVVLLITGRHIFAVIGGVAAIYALMLWGKGGEGLMFQAGINLLNWYPLITLPMFIYMGYMFSVSGIADDLYTMFHVWMGPVKGGLAIGTIFLQTIIAAMNGLSVAGMAIGSALALPEMLKRKYDKVMVTGVIQGSSSLGIMVPPSVVLVLYGMIARQPIGRLWLAGVFPGLMIAALFIIYIAVRCIIQPEIGPALSKEERDRYSFKDKLRLLTAAIAPIIIIFMMSGLFFLGVTSLVESSAVGAGVTTIAAILNKRLTWKGFMDVLKQTLSVSAMFMWVILAALGFGAVFDGLGAVHAIKKLFLGWGFGKWGILLMMQLSFIFLGTFLDDTAMLILVAPLYVPLVVELGFNTIWYGILYTITCQVAYLTPPFGYNLFLMKAMVPKDSGITLGDIYRSVIPFVLLLVVSLGIVMIFPELATWLPSKYFKG